MKFFVPLFKGLEDHEFLEFCIKVFGWRHAFVIFSPGESPESD
jgi:hypothetical protein